MPKQIIAALKHLIETFSISDSSMQGWGTTQSVGMPMCNIAVAEYYLTSSQVWLLTTCCSTRTMKWKIMRALTYMCHLLVKQLANEKWQLSCRTVCLHFCSAVVHSWLDFLLSKLWLQLKKLMDGEYNLCMLTFPFLFLLLLHDYYGKYKT